MTRNFRRNTGSPAWTFSKACRVGCDVPRINLIHQRAGGGPAREELTGFGGRALPPPVGVGEIQGSSEEAHGEAPPGGTIASAGLAMIGPVVASKQTFSLLTLMKGILLTTANQVQAWPCRPRLAVDATKKEALRGIGSFSRREALAPGAGGGRRTFDADVEGSSVVFQHPEPPAPHFLPERQLVSAQEIALAPPGQCDIADEMSIGDSVANEIVGRSGGCELGEMLT
ncbi:MAG TPA: hypothetical protein VMP68_01760 [Candidatus Eisenbacteria bacterium]|nr:hypothetical protein [Candidatus Eisenbacteria bacterium]